MAVRAEDDVDARHGAGQGVVVVEMLMADHHHGVDVLALAQVAHRLARRRHRIAKRESFHFDQRREIVAGQGEYTDARPV